MQELPVMSDNARKTKNKFCDLLFSMI